MDALSCHKLKLSLHLTFLNQLCQPFSTPMGLHQLSLMTGGQPTSDSEDSQVAPTQPARGHTSAASGPATRTARRPPPQPAWRPLCRASLPTTNTRPPAASGAPTLPDLPSQPGPAPACVVLSSMGPTFSLGPRVMLSPSRTPAASRGLAGLPLPPPELIVDERRLLPASESLKGSSGPQSLCPRECLSTTQL